MLINFVTNPHLYCWFLSPQLSDPQVNIPLHSAEHFLNVTKPMAGIVTPACGRGISRSFSFYRCGPHDACREGLLWLYLHARVKLKGFWGAIPCGSNPPARIPPQLLPEDWDHFHKKFHHERSILRRDLE